MKRHILIFLLLASWIIAAAGAPLAGAQEGSEVPAPVPPAVERPEGNYVLRVYYDNPAQIRRLVELDLFEFNNTKERYVLVGANRDVHAALERLGFRVEIDAAATADINQPHELLPGQVNGIPGYTCYRTVEETFQTAQDIVAAHPTLATWSDVGNSWEKSVGQPDGYDMLVLVLTNSAVAGPKPKLLITASIHAREYTPAEMATRFAEYLVENYGVDPDATWLLDHHEIHLMLQANPDGRKEAETGLSWRKNTNENYCGATSNNRGADLNRNFSFYWNSCSGCSSGNPCDLTYRGPTPASEPETQAIQNYLQAIFPDQREAALSAAAPADATGLYLDLHSYSELVLWSWGFTSSAAPNGAALQTLGRKFAYHNNYTPQQSYELYGTDGTTDDFAYGELGVAAYTFEMGTAFFQDCGIFENTIVPANMPALVYAAKVARTPYQTPAGPDALNVAVAPVDVTIGAPATLTATLNDTRYNNTNGAEPTQSITAAEYYIDVPAWQAGAVAVAMLAADGSFNSTVESVTAVVDTANLAPGRHILFVRGRDADGNWGAFSAAFLTTRMFTISPASLAICAPTDAAYTVDVGYANSVALSASGQPEGATTIFSPNPVSGPAASTLTIGNTGGASAGSYTIAVTGAGGAYDQTTSVQLDVATAAPTAAMLVAPLDGSTGVATTPIFTWNAAARAVSYDIEIATDPAFTGIVASAAGLTATSFTPGSALNMDGMYYWRVRAANACGAPWSAVAAFRTAATGCITYTSSDVPKNIQDLTWVESTLNIPDAYAITDVNVTLGRINHTYDADLDIYLQHPDTTEIRLSDDNGSGGDNYVDTVFDDEATTAITSGAAPFTGSYRPEVALSGLDGKPSGGAWRLRIYDDANTDTGTLQSWSLTLCGGSTAVAADYSDLASGYGVAWHTGSGGVRLGPVWTADSSFAAAADDASDDGVARGAWSETTGAVTLTVTGATGYVAGWFDWNQDGDFADDGELAFANEQVSAGQTKAVTFPAGTLVYGKTIGARFRVYPAAQTGLAAITPAAAPQAIGAAADGEDEDYAWYFSPLAVTLASFTAETAGDGVILAWETVSETANAGFNVYRATGGSVADRPQQDWVRLNPTLIPAVTPGSSGGHVYTWVDVTATPDASYVYRLEAVDLAGNGADLGVVSVTYRPAQRRWLPLIGR